jgi:hypothetical protein
MLGKFKIWLNEFLYGKEEPVKNTTVCSCDCHGNCGCACGCNGECQCKKTVILPVERVEIEHVEIVIPVREPLPEIIKPKRENKPFSTKEAAKNKMGKKSAVKKPKKNGR